MGRCALSMISSRSIDDKPCLFPFVVLLVYISYFVDVMKVVLDWDFLARDTSSTLLCALCFVFSLGMPNFSLHVLFGYIYSPKL